MTDLAEKFLKSLNMSLTKELKSLFLIKIIALSEFEKDNRALSVPIFPIFFNFPYIVLFNSKTPYNPYDVRIKKAKRHTCSKLQDRLSSVDFSTVYGANLQEVSVLLPE